MDLIISAPTPTFTRNSGFVILLPMAKARVADHETELEVARLRFQLQTRIVDGCKVVAWIIAAWVPLSAVATIARNIAGKQTQFTATISITIAISVFLSIGWGVTAARSHGRKREVDRLRKRNDNLEQRLQAAEQRAGSIIGQRSAASEETLDSEEVEE